METLFHLEGRLADNVVDTSAQKRVDVSSGSSHAKGWIAVRAQFNATTAFDQDRMCQQRSRRLNSWFNAGQTGCTLKNARRHRDGGVCIDRVCICSLYCFSLPLPPSSVSGILELRWYRNAAGCWNAESLCWSLPTWCNSIMDPVSSIRQPHPP